MDTAQLLSFSIKFRARCTTRTRPLTTPPFPSTHDGISTTLIYETHILLAISISTTTATHLLLRRPYVKFRLLGDIVAYGRQLDLISPPTTERPISFGLGYPRWTTLRLHNL